MVSMLGRSGPRTGRTSESGPPPGPAPARSGHKRTFLLELVAVLGALVSCETTFHLTALWIYTNDLAIEREFRFLITLNAWLRVPLIFFFAYLVWLPVRQILLPARRHAQWMVGFLLFGALGAFLGWLSTQIDLL